MQKGRVLKGEGKGLEEELKLINKYTRRELSENDVYIFSVVLCDNDIDRDYEQFDTDSLYRLAQLFTGKTGIMDHNPSAKNQTARIFSCRVENVPGRKTKTGEDYYRLTARAYLPRTEKNKELIANIDSGINKEVSVGCAVEQVVCSICSKDRKTQGCSHVPGAEYGGSLCRNILKNPTDAYEWSFVAVPAQIQAGVIKAFNLEEKSMNEIMKSLKAGVEIRLTAAEARKLYEQLAANEQDAENGRLYRKQLQDEVVRLSMIVQPEISKSIMTELAEKMSINQLKTFQQYFMSKTESCLAPKPQLYSGKKAKSEAYKNNEFNI